MSKMQAEAAPAIPVDAPIIAYLEQLPTAVPADLLGSLIAMEAKAVHQVIHDTAQALSLRPGWKLVSVCLFLLTIHCICLSVICSTPFSSVKTKLIPLEHSATMTLAKLSTSAPAHL